MRAVYRGKRAAYSVRAGLRYSDWYLSGILRLVPELVPILVPELVPILVPGGAHRLGQAVYAAWYQAERAVWYRVYAGLASKLDPQPLKPHNHGPRKRKTGAVRHYAVISAVFHSFFPSN
jgi:hypothetical protein